MAEKVKKPLAVKTEYGSKLIEINRYKLTNAPRKYNKGYVPGRPDLIDQQHSHYWNDASARTGEKNERSSFQGGHCHMVKAEWDETGTKLVGVHCGPALKEVEVKGPRGNFIKKLVPISFKLAAEIGGGEIVDDHSHDVDYVGTQEMSSSAFQKKREEEAARLKANLIHGSGPSQARALNQAEADASRAKDFGIVPG